MVEHGLEIVGIASIAALTGAEVVGVAWAVKNKKINPDKK